MASLYVIRFVDGKHGLMSSLAATVDVHIIMFQTDIAVGEKKMKYCEQDICRCRKGFIMKYGTVYISFWQNTFILSEVKGCLRSVSQAAKSENFRHPPPGTTL